jgi:DNA-binding transcriptional LysR family regulator
VQRSARREGERAGGGPEHRDAEHDLELTRLAAFGSAYATFLPAAIARFLGEHPAVELELAEQEPDASLPLLRTGEVDLAIIYGEHATDGLEPTHLLDDEHRAVLPARHRLARGDGVTVDDLRDEPWIVPAAGGPAGAYRSALVALAQDSGFTPRVAVETHKLQAVQALVAAGLGVALMHDLTMPTRRHDIAVLPIRGPRLTRQVHAVTVAGRRHPPAAAMLRALRAVSLDPGAENIENRPR